MSIRTFLPIKSDIIFRLFYGDERNKEFLISFLMSIIMLPEDDYYDIAIADPHLLSEFDGDKFAVIDVKLYTKTGKIIHIEIQLKVTAELIKRIVFYEAKLITEQLGSGDNYDTINKVISIIITDENLIENSPKYHHRFTLFDPNADIEFTDILEIHTLELRKLPDISDGTKLYDWAKFIAAETEEELTMVAERNDIINKAVVRLRELSADEKARDLHERREKARRDKEMYLKWATEQGMQQGIQQGMQQGIQQGVQQEKSEIARNLVSMNMPVEQIITITGLSREEIDGLKNC